MQERRSCDEKVHGVFFMICDQNGKEKVFMDEKIKGSTIAGSWYPSDPGELRYMLEGFLSNVRDGGPREGVKGLISPHAGYVFSGQIAAHGYHRIRKDAFNQVIVMAPSHRFPLVGASVGNYTHFLTPLGKVPVSTRSAALALQCPLVSTLTGPHEEEHALELQLPFLQMVLEEFALIPLVLGQMNDDQMKVLSTALLDYVDETTLIVVSTDLSHFFPYEEAVSKDRVCIDSILNMDRTKAFEQEMCGKFPVLTFLNMALEKGWSPELLKYANSGDVSGDRRSVVGYASILFREDLRACSKITPTAVGCGLRWLRYRPKWAFNVVLLRLQPHFCRFLALESLARPRYGIIFKQALRADSR